jgi:uncharacterized Zn-binding protein involved in type VI secretion
MFPASTNSSSGQCFAFPDVCKTPTPTGPVPIPYPNIATLQQADTSTLAQSVKIAGFYAATVQTQIPMSSGDEAGSLGGVISNTVKGSCQFRIGSSTVKMEGQGAAYLGSMIGHNNASNANMPTGSQISPSQSTVTVGP